MPVDPGPCKWSLPDPAKAIPGEELLAVGADLAPATMLYGYRHGLFPMDVQIKQSKTALGWWSPNPRGILRPTDFHSSRSMLRASRRFEVTVDTTFDEVVARCADPSRPHGWISADFRAAYRRLYELGWAHSIEVWLPSTPGGTRELVGGLFGVEIGGFFAAESKFHTQTDASKVAVKALAYRQAAAPEPADRIVDVQWRTDHLATLGAIGVDRDAYLPRLARAIALPSAF
jgi:leucyl/phenylalanyl-tRNA---protein transferase